MEICGVPSQAAEVIATYPILVAAFSGGQNEHLGFGVSSQNSCLCRAERFQGETERVLRTNLLHDIHMDPVCTSLVHSRNLSVKGQTIGIARHF